MAIIKGKVIQARTKNPNLLDQHRITSDGLDSAHLQATQYEAQSIIDAARSEAERRAAEILAAAEAERSRLLADARNQLQAISDEKAKLEYMREEFKRQAYEQGIAEAKSIIDELIKILASFQVAKEHILKEAEEEIGSIALIVAEKLLQAEIKRDKSAKALLTRQIRAAIAKVVAGNGMVKILVAPGDMVVAKSIKTALAKVLDEGVKLYFEADETVAPASCIIETKGGRFDASFTTQIKVIKVALEKYLGHKLIDLDERYLKNSEMDMLAAEPKHISIEPSDDDLESLLRDIEAGSVFDPEDEAVNAKADDDLFDDDLELDDDSDDEDEFAEEEDEDDVVQVEDEDEFGATDDDLDLEDELDAEDDPFADEDSDPEDERFPEY